MNASLWTTDITILNIYMRDNKSLKENKEILTVLRRIRNEYLEKN